ncbi:MAG: TIGR01212 family radical SAM protein, partial [Treponema sp.]|nr:TIGR01212 family radical SAM protein [Treponema sp.]
LSTAGYLSRLDPVLDGIKIQLLHVLRGTPLEKIYREKPFHLPTLEEYCAFIPEYISHLNPRTVIHRLTGDGPKRLLIAPAWTADKKRVINALKKSVEEYEAPVL